MPQRCRDSWGIWLRSFVDVPSTYPCRRPGERLPSGATIPGGGISRGVYGRNLGDRRRRTAVGACAPRHTGRLTILSDDEVQIYLAGGKVILVSSNKHALRLGRILLRLGIVESAHLDAAVREQDKQEEMRPLGQILLDAGWVTGGRTRTGRGRTMHRGVDKCDCRESRHIYVHPRCATAIEKGISMSIPTDQYCSLTTVPYCSSPQPQSPPRI